MGTVAEHIPAKGQVRHQRHKDPTSWQDRPKNHLREHQQVENIFVVGRQTTRRTQDADIHPHINSQAEEYSTRVDPPMYPATPGTASPPTIEGNAHPAYQHQNGKRGVKNLPVGSSQTNDANSHHDWQQAQEDQTGRATTLNR